MNYSFRETAISWLKEKGFEEKEIEELQIVLNDLKLYKKKDDPVIILPKHTSKRVAAIVYLLNSITDEDGAPMCFDKAGLIEIPEDAKNYYENELELEELEDAIGKLQKTKIGRVHSSPRRRGSVKNERY
ncbi:hypothetical protein KKB44_05740 [Candidatus Micrarchaeota archaeon]|nr:hypothetical protein [Candidatus Micrarchaeota archaeon]